MTLHFEDILIGWPLLQQGLITTLVMALIVIVLSMAGGLVLGVCRHYGPGWLRQPVALYIEFVRSIPLILLLAFTHYGIMFWVNNLLQRPSAFLESAVIAMVLFESAYIAEIIRGGLRSIRDTERDAAISLGLNFGQRLWHVYLPLAYQRTVPALIGQCIALIKDTSLASIIGVQELTRQGEILYQNTFHDFEVLIVIALMYFAICYGLSQLSRRFEFGATQQQLYAASVQG